MRRLILGAGILIAGLQLADVPPAAVTPAAAANAQEAGPHPGRAVVLSKCFQCHTDAMFRDQRQDRPAWEATIYRMVGRGGLWTPEEIRLMADYLGTEFGPDARRAPR